MTWQKNGVGHFSSNCLVPSYVLYLPTLHSSISATVRRLESTASSSQRGALRSTRRNRFFLNILIFDRWNGGRVAVCPSKKESKAKGTNSRAGDTTGTYYYYVVGGASTKKHRHNRTPRPPNNSTKSRRRAASPCTRRYASYVSGTEQAGPVPSLFELFRT